MHDGSVNVASAGERRGTTFRDAPAAGDDRRGADACSPAGAERNAAQRRILVVDDNEDAANTLAMILKLEGHESTPPTPARQALERIDEFGPDVVLLDIGLPGLDGMKWPSVSARRQPIGPLSWWPLRVMARKPTGQGLVMPDSRITWSNPLILRT